MYTIISATNRPESNSMIIAKCYLDLLQEIGIEANILSLTELPENFLQSDFYGNRSEAFKPIAELIDKTHTFFFVIPEYNGSFPGILKALIDSLNPKQYFWGKNAILIGLSDGKFGNLRGLEHFNGILNYIRVNTFPNRVHLMNITGLIQNNKVVNENALNEIKTQVNQFFNS